MSAGRILITGATGFVGRYLVRHFLSLDRTLTLAVREVDNCPLPWRNHNRIKIIETGRIETASNLGDALAASRLLFISPGLPMSVTLRGGMIRSSQATRRQRNGWQMRR